MKFKRILCAALCACLLLAAVVIPAGAAGCGCGEVVQVYMEGFGSPLYYNFGTPEQEVAGMARTDNLAFGIGRLLGGARRGLWQRSWAPFADGTRDLVMGLMGHLALDPQGNSLEPITNHWQFDAKQDHKKEPEYIFDFDFRMDPFDTAKQLDEFIRVILKATGHSKVALTGSSEGAVICMTYLKQYGTKHLDTLILVNGAWQGLTLAGELLTNKFGMSGPSVTNYIGNFDDGSGSLKLAMALLRDAHVLDFLQPLGETLMDGMGEEIYADILLPLFGMMPILWAFVPNEYYAEARKFLTGDPACADLLARADRYQKEVQTQAGRLLKNAVASGAKVAVLAGYGGYPIPVTQNETFQCDTMIDTAYESGGATTAPIGQQLPPSNSKYRSPDGVIDAATCILPDQTWFVKNSGHNAWPSRELRQWIIHYKGKPTVWSSADWPQYLINVDGEAQAYRG